MPAISSSKTQESELRDKIQKSIDRYFRSQGKKHSSHPKRDSRQQYDVNRSVSVVPFSLHPQRMLPYQTNDNGQESVEESPALKSLLQLNSAILDKSRYKARFSTARKDSNNSQSMQRNVRDRPSEFSSESPEKKGTGITRMNINLKPNWIAPSDGFI